ncbi:MAG: malonyl-CoA decarboxylase family protein [Oceanospirillaceae bacterium]|nr:malonyl-CoA decarboxylase family protein [Oceanospirillaceae bacterium]
MIGIGWLEGLLNSVADHGRELIGIKDGAEDNDFTDAKLCLRLLKGKGEATNIALAREILRRWQLKGASQKLAFLNLLSNEFDLDHQAIATAAADYCDGDKQSLATLISLTEAPRQELFRRLNMAPSGTAILVAMRSTLLKLLSEHPQLRNVDEDFQHLLGSWFNRGFLQLERISWQSSASVLEKLIEYEAVHPMQGWEDLRRRLNDKDRRCYGFFHPALPDVPLIFVEVALTTHISDAIGALVDPLSEISNAQPNTAIFYSINNALTGLRGVSFGNFLIKQVAEELKDEFQQIDTFSTLSPIPKMRKTIHSYLETEGSKHSLVSIALVQSQLRAILEIEKDTPLDMTIIEKQIETNPELKLKLCLFYLTVLKRQDKALDPVANFHLSNGACLHRINIDANTSQRGNAESWGAMVNYLYENDTVVSNHEAYAYNGEIPLSKDLQRQYKQLGV